MIEEKYIKAAIIGYWRMGASEMTISIITGIEYKKVYTFLNSLKW